VARALRGCKGNVSECEREYVSDDDTRTEGVVGLVIQTHSRMNLMKGNWGRIVLILNLLVALQNRFRNLMGDQK
jgi:hypothetical protein